MKYLLVIAVVLVAFWVWRNNRQQERGQVQRQTSRPPTAPTSPVRMVACLHCGTHLPETDAVAGARGAYCNRDHLRREEPSS